MCAVMPNRSDCKELKNASSKEPVDHKGEGAEPWEQGAKLRRAREHKDERAESREH